MRLYAEHNDWDDFFLAMEIFVALFYLYYFVDEAQELWKEGRRSYFQDKTNWVMFVNILCYVLQ